MGSVTVSVDPLSELGKEQISQSYPGRSQPLHEMCAFLTRDREQKVTSAMTHRREMKIMSRLEKNLFESDTFASRKYIKLFLFPSHLKYDRAF